MILPDYDRFSLLTFEWEVQRKRSLNDVYVQADDLVAVAKTAGHFV